MSNVQPRAPDPGVRYFLLRGTLIAGTRQWLMFEAAHADDLPEGEAGKTEIAERVRRYYAAQIGDPGARWSDDLDMIERQPDAVIDGQIEWPL